jgi:hypothetical protein
MQFELAPRFFHASRSNAKKVFLDHHGAVVNDLAEVRVHATPLVRSFTNERSLEDWRHWVLHVSDDQGDGLFVVPLVLVLGKRH